MAPIKTTYKSDFVRPKVHHFTSVSKLKKKTVKFSDKGGKDAERKNKCLAAKEAKIPEKIDLYPFVKICSYENLCPGEKTTYQTDFPDANPPDNHRVKKELEQDPCRFLHDPNRFPRVESDVTHSRNSTKRNVKTRYPRAYTDVTQKTSSYKKMSNKVATTSRHMFDRKKPSDISDALPGGTCKTTSTEYQDGIGTYKGIFREKKPDSHPKFKTERICKDAGNCDL